MSELDKKYDEMTVRELRELAAELGVAQRGSKEEIIERLSLSLTETLDEKVETLEPADPLAEARKHFLRLGSVSGDYIFDDIPGSVCAKDLFEAFQKWNETPAKLRVPGSHT